MRRGRGERPCEAAVANDQGERKGRANVTTTGACSSASPATPAIREDLRRAEALGAHHASAARAESGATEPVELIETHVSWVFLAGSEVFKVKKPKNLGFLDFSTLASRRAACEAEVELNLRLAPDVYKGLAPVRLGADGRAALTGDGPVIDWAVHMRRLSDARRADVMLAAGELTEALIERIAARMARFHAAARADAETARFGDPQVIAVNVRENFEQTRASIETFLTPAEASEIEASQLAFLERRADLFKARAAAGMARDGHGDLRLEHIYIEPSGEVVIIDCIEFNDRFRYADTCSDVAFLSMDLAWHGRVDLAELFLASYARETDDYDMYPLVDFYEGYRAYVRGKVAAILAADEGAGDEARARAAAQARRYFLLALSASHTPLVPPSVIAVGGVIGTGKSSVATAISRRTGAVIVEADRTRKNMLGVRHTQKLTDPSWAGAYERGFTDAVYQELLRRGSKALDARRPVVLDASFRSASMRAGAKELAARYGVPFLFVECRAAREVCLERLRRRQRETSVSDGRVEIFDEFSASYEPVTELARGEHLPVDSSGSLEATLAFIARCNSPALAGLNAPVA